MSWSWSASFGTASPSSELRRHPQVDQGQHGRCAGGRRRGSGRRVRAEPSGATQYGPQPKRRRGRAVVIATAYWLGGVFPSDEGLYRRERYWWTDHVSSRVGRSCRKVGHLRGCVASAPFRGGDQEVPHDRIRCARWGVSGVVGRKTTQRR